MQLKFRKLRVGLEAWHFIQACPDWPEADYSEQLDTPPISEFCERCVELSAGELSDIPRRKAAPGPARRVGNQEFPAK